MIRRDVASFLLGRFPFFSFLSAVQRVMSQGRLLHIIAGLRDHFIFSIVVLGVKIDLIYPQQHRGGFEFYSTMHCSDPQLIMACFTLGP